MPTYAGVEFSVELGGGRMPIDFEREEKVSVTHIPGSDEEDVQWAGLGNGRLTLPAVFDDYADYLTLKAARGVTSRTLSHAGLTFNNVILLRVSKPTKNPERDAVFADLEFMQVSA